MTSPDNDSSHMWTNVDHRLQEIRAKRERAALQTEEGRSRIPPMDREVTTKDYIDRSMDAVRAQNDVRFTEVLSKIDALGGKIDAIKSDAITWKGVWGAAAATTVAVGGLLLGILAIGGDRFDGGMAASGVISSMTQEQQARDRAQDEKLDAVISRIDALLDAQAIPTAPAPETPTE